MALIKSIHAEFKTAYGSRRMHRELQDGRPPHRPRVERLMREHGIRARHKRRFKSTTDSKHSMPVAPNLLARNFTTLGARPCVPRWATARRFGSWRTGSASMVPSNPRRPAGKRNSTG